MLTARRDSGGDVSLAVLFGWRRTLVRMPAHPVPGLPCSSVAEANEAIRRFVAGRACWSRAELAELDRLRAVWAEAVRAEMVQAA